MKHYDTTPTCRECGSITRAASKETLHGPLYVSICFNTKCLTPQCYTCDNTCSNSRKRRKYTCLRALRQHLREKHSQLHDGKDGTSIEDDNESHQQTGYTSCMDLSHPLDCDDLYQAQLNTDGGTPIPSITDFASKNMKEYQRACITFSPCHAAKKLVLYRLLFKKRYRTGWWIYSWTRRLLDSS
jgi:hypothetical protein